MTSRKSAVAAVAAMALCLSLAAGAADATLATARTAAKSGTNARLGASLAVLQKAATARRLATSANSQALARKLPVLRATDGYVSISAYGDDLAALKAQLVSKGLLDATAHSTAVSADSSSCDPRSSRPGSTLP
jgi:hypothetical protein